MIENISCVDLVQVLGFRANAEEIQWFLCVIEHNNVVSLSDYWSLRSKLRSLAPGQSGRSGNYLFQSPQKERALTYSDAWHFVHSRCARFPTRNMAGLKF